MGDDEPDEAKDIQFLPNKTFLRVNHEKTIRLHIKRKMAVDGEVILIGCNNEKIQVRPETITIDKKRYKSKDYLTYRVFLFCEELREKGIITAITPSKSKGKDVTANCEITDVKSEVILEAPEDIEFRPAKVVGLPNKITTSSLYINLEKIPKGRMIKFKEIDITGNISLYAKGEKTTSAKIVISSKHEIEKGLIAKVPILFIGTGKGQHAKVLASTKEKGGGDKKALLKIEIGEPKTEGDFIFKASEYTDLDDLVSAMVVPPIIYINSRHPINRKVFGENKAQFDERILESYEAQLRYAEIILDSAVFYTADVKEKRGGKKGLTIPHRLAVQSIQRFVDTHKFELAPKVYMAIVPNFKSIK